MPMTFADRWNHVNLSKLKLGPVAPDADPATGLGNIARFWKAKTRLKHLGPTRLDELDEKIDTLEQARQAKLLDSSARYTGKMAADQKAAADERLTIGNALVRDKVTAPMVKKFSPELVAGLTGGRQKLLDPVMEQIHNDRLRIDDRDMLPQADGLAIRRAIVAAKPRFTQDAKVAAMFARAVALDGDAVIITQGVHQSDDPHFDVRMPGEDQQYHVDVTLGTPLSIRSVSYMRGPRKSDGVRRVGADGQPVVDIV